MQRAIWIVTFLIIIAGAYYYAIIHDADAKEVQTITEQLELQDDRINTIAELQDRLELRYIGHGKHLQDIQNDFRDHYTAYTAKMDSINQVFAQIEYDVQALSDRLNRKIDKLREDLENLDEQYASDRRVQDTRMRDLEKSTERIDADIKGLLDDLALIKEKVKLD